MGFRWVKCILFSWFKVLGNWISYILNIWKWWTFKKDVFNFHTADYFSLPKITKSKMLLLKRCHQLIQLVSFFFVKKKLRLIFRSYFIGSFLIVKIDLNFEMSSKKDIKLNSLNAKNFWTSSSTKLELDSKFWWKFALGFFWV